MAHTTKQRNKTYLQALYAVIHLGWFDVLKGGIIGVREITLTGADLVAGICTIRGWPWSDAIGL